MRTLMKILKTSLIFVSVWIASLILCELFFKLAVSRTMGDQVILSRNIVVYIQYFVVPMLIGTFLLDSFVKDFILPELILTASFLSYLACYFIEGTFNPNALFLIISFCLNSLVIYLATKSKFLRMRNTKRMNKRKRMKRAQPLFRKTKGFTAMPRIKNF